MSVRTELYPDELFECAGGTVRGKDHVQGDTPNQDSLFFEGNMYFVFGVVCDGCGSAPHSDVGSQLACRFLYQSIFSRFLNWSADDRAGLVKFALDDLVHRISDIALAMGENRVFPAAKENRYLKVLNDYFLFTVNGFLITPKQTILFHSGDGVYILNDNYYQIPPLPGNYPPYIAYRLGGTSIDPKKLEPTIITSDTDDVSNIIVGSDGVEDLKAAEEKNIPGKSELVGPLSQFYENDRFYKNRFNIQRRLSLVNRTVNKRDLKTGDVRTEHGLLHDDTTLIACRRFA